jgi:hypothetical protein
MGQQAYGSCVGRTFHRLAWPTFFALTHQQCALCKKPWKGAVSQIGAYIHKICRLGSPDAFVNVAYLDKQRRVCQQEKADRHFGKKTQGFVPEFGPLSVYCSQSSIADKGYTKSLEFLPPLCYALYVASRCGWILLHFLVCLSISLCAGN